MCDVKLRHYGVSECCDRLELESHSGPGQEEHCEDQPPIPHVGLKSLVRK